MSLLGWTGNRCTGCSSAVTFCRDRCHQINHSWNLLVFKSVITPQNCIYVDAVARQSVLHKNLRPGVKGVAIWSLSLTLPSVHPTLSAITLISSQQVTVTVFHSATNRFHGKQSKATGTKKTQSRANTLEQTQQHWQICITHRHDEMQHTPCLFTPTVTNTVWTMGMCPPKSKQRTVSHLWM